MHCVSFKNFKGPISAGGPNRFSFAATEEEKIDPSQKLEADTSNVHKRQHPPLTEVQGA